VDDDTLRALLAVGDPVVDADLTGLDLRDAVATAGARVRLVRCRAVEPDLRGVDLTGAVLEQCVVTGAALHGAVLDGARVVGGTRPCRRSRKPSRGAPG